SVNASRLEKIIEKDALLIQTVQPIKILGALSWPSDIETKFLESWHRGKPELPDVHLEQQNYSKQIEALEVIQSRCDRARPLDNLILKTARSYTSAARMLAAIGTPGFTNYSIELYGKPNDNYKTQDWTALDAADFFSGKQMSC
ncbi:MAG: tyrosine/phenylalanine carboxypeptidase domain-containing protein, partial [Arenicellales bacterium]